MAHTFETAPSGRSKCRGCGRAIEKGALRFGERLPNPFAEGEMTLWFHPECAAYKRPEPLLEALQTITDKSEDQARVERMAQNVSVHRRLQRIDGAEFSPSGQAKCRHCREPIERGTWRIRLIFYEDGMFTPGGFVHLACGPTYFETGELLDHVLHFSRDFTAEQTEEFSKAFAAVQGRTL